MQLSRKTARLCGMLLCAAGALFTAGCDQDSEPACFHTVFHGYDGPERPIDGVAILLLRNNFNGGSDAGICPIGMDDREFLRMPAFSTNLKECGRTDFTKATDFANFHLHHGEAEYHFLPGEHTVAAAFTKNQGEADLHGDPISVKFEFESGFVYDLFCDSQQPMAMTPKSVGTAQLHILKIIRWVPLGWAAQTVPIQQPDGTTKPASLFVAVLGANDKTYAEAFMDQQLPSWIAGHCGAAVEDDDNGISVTNYRLQKSQVWIQRC